MTTKKQATQATLNLAAAPATISTSTQPSAAPTATAGPSSSAAAATVAGCAECAKCAASTTAPASPADHITPEQKLRLTPADALAHAEAAHQLLTDDLITPTLVDAAANALLMVTIHQLHKAADLLKQREATA